MSNFNLDFLLTVYYFLIKLPEHAFVDQIKAHPLGDDDVDLRDGQLDFFDHAVNDLDSVAQIVGFDDGARELADRVACLDGVDLLGAGLCREHGQHARARATIQNYL